MQLKNLKVFLKITIHLTFCINFTLIEINLIPNNFLQKIISLIMIIIEDFFINANFFYI